MASVNKVMLLGHLGKDPLIKQMSNGKNMATFSLATSESWKDKAGQWQNKTEWHNVVVMNDALANIASKYLQKGSKVFVEGKIQTSKYKNKDGAEQSSVQIVIDQFKGSLTLLDKFDSKSNFEELKENPAVLINLDANISDEIPF